MILARLERRVASDSRGRNVRDFVRRGESIDARSDVRDVTTFHVLHVQDLGVLPLALSTGAGAASRHSIGTGVIGGMLAATFIAVLFIPLFFVWTSKAGDAVRRRFAPAAARQEP